MIGGGSRARRIYGSGRQSSPASRRFVLCCTLIVVPALLAAFCGAGIIVCGVLVVRPVVRTGSLGFKETTCTTTEASFTGTWVKCNSCVNCRTKRFAAGGSGINVRFPCLVINVTYHVNNQDFSGILYETEARLDWSMKTVPLCATQPTCERDDAYTGQKVERFAKTYGVGKTYKCLYNPDNAGDGSAVLLRRHFTQQSVIHSMLWLSLGMVLFVGIVVYMCCQCKKARDQMMATPGTAPASSVPPNATMLRPIYNSQYAPNAAYTNPVAVPSAEPPPPSYASVVPGPTDLTQLGVSDICVSK